MAVENGGNACLHLRTLFNVGAIGALSDGQLLERFTNGRGEPKELAFAALVERHGPSVLRVCRSILRNADAADDAFQATFMALARKAGSLWAKDSLAPWLHRAAYRAAIHDRSAIFRRRSHEHSAAALRPESVAPPHHANADHLETIIHEEIDRLPGRFRVAVVLCDLEGRTHEQAASHLGCAVGTVKSRLSRGRKRLRGRLVRRGVAPALAAASAGSAARAVVPASLAESTVVFAATASAIPESVAVITEGALKSMFLSKVKLVMKAFAVVAALAAGAVALAQSGISKPKDGAGKSQHVGSPIWTYHILVSRDGEPPRKVAVVEMSGDAPIRVDAPGALILIQPKRDGEPGRQTATEKRDRNKRTRQATDEKAGREIVLTSPKAMDVDLTQQYVCQIHSRRHIDVCALATGHLNEIKVRDGQAVKKGDLMFNIIPTDNDAKLDAYATDIKAPFDGVIDRLHEQQGSLVKEGDVLTTLSDNSVMWVYYNMPESQYLEFMANRKQFEGNRIELVLADQTKFPQPGSLKAIDSKFNNETGNIAFRADFPNPEGLLRHGQTGTILIHRKVHDVVVIPQQATFEIDDKRYVYAVGKDDVVHRRPIVAQHETDDIFVIKKGVGVDDRIVLEGIRQVRDGEKVEFEFRPLEEVMRKRKKHAD
jgi:membrane fusion protein, multidrug efflux system